MNRMNILIGGSNETSTSAPKSSQHFASTPLMVLESFLYLLTVFFHSCGLYLLIKVKKNHGDIMVSYTHKRLLALLSGSELLHGIGRIINCIRIITMFDAGVIFEKIIFFIMSITGAIGFSAVNFITVNRLLSAVSPHWYRQYMTKGKFIAVVVSVVAILATATTFTTIHGESFTKSKFVSSVPKYKMGRFVICISQILYFVFCIFTYISICNTLL